MKKKQLYTFFFIFLTFFIFSQAAEVPSGANKYLQNATPTSSGDQDRVNVIFFEIPESVGASTMIYFGIYDPGTDNTNPDSRGTAGIQTYYYLIGGSGALSHPNSKLINYAGDTSRARVGTVLSTFTADDTGAYQNAWYYFPNGVRVDQGEKIGSKYYFKVVVEIQYSATLNKNAYKAGVSFSNSGTPTGITGANAFLYCWTVVFLNNTGTNWNFYPFVPDSATGNIVFRNFDMDNGEELFATNITGTTIVNFPITRSGDSALNTLETHPTSPASTFPIGTERDGTWLYRVSENNSGPGDTRNTADIFAYNSPNDGTTVSEYYRVYSSYIAKPPTPTYDHVALSYEDGIAVTGVAPTDAGETVVLQIVDINNNPVSYSRKIYVSVTGSALIMSSNTSTAENSINSSATVVTTDSTGMGWIKIKNATAEIITVNLLTNGTNGSDNFGDGIDDTINIEFVSDPDPTLSSQNNMTFTVGAGSTAIPTLTINHPSITSKLTDANEIYIRIPSALNCSFDTTVTNPTFGGSASGKVDTTPPPPNPVDYPDSKTIRIYLQSNFLTGENLTISGLRMQNFISESSGRLELSFNGGLTYTVIDNKVYSILDNSPPTITARDSFDLNGDGYIDAVRVTFSKAINDSTVNSANFALTGGVTLNPFSSTTNGDVANNNVIYLTFTDGILLTDATPTLTYTPGSLKDLAGNSLGSSSANITDRAGPAILSAVASDQTVIITGIDNDDTVTITFSENTNQPAITSVNINSVLQLSGGHTWLDGSNNITSAIWSDARTLVITLSTTTALPTVAVGDTITLNGTTITDTLGNNSTTVTFSNITGTFSDDTTPPTITARDSFDLNGDGYIDAVRVTFSEPINDSTVNSADFALTGGVTLNPFSSTTNGDVANNNVIYLTFTDGILLTDATPTLTYTAGTLTDLPGNPLGSSSASITDTAGPAILSAVASDQTVIITGIDNDDTVTITFSENTNQPAITSVNINSVLQLSGGHTWLDGSNNITSAIWSDARTLVITLSTTTALPTVAVGDTITLDGTTITDTLANNSTTVTFSNITGNFTGPGTPPTIILTRACVGSNQIYVEFNEAVFTDTSGNPIVPADFFYDSTTSGSGFTIQSIAAVDTSNRRFIFRVSGNLTERAIVNDLIRSATNASVFSSSYVAMLDSTSYAISDIGENFFTNVQLTIQNDPSSTVTQFDASLSIRKETYRVYANIFVNDPAYDSLTPQLAFDFFNDKNSALFWDPDTQTTDIVVNGTNVGGTRWEFIIPKSSNMKSGKYLSFVFKIGSLKCYRARFTITSSNFSPYYATSYVVKIKDVAEQNSNVTILNNVINPHKGEKTKLLYYIDTPGPVSIVVYDINSDVVMVLKSENQEKGKYSVVWDGRNQNGKIVARGVYLIRVRAPGIFNQIRKVLVIR